ncbi:unnamed protein product [Rhizophagus irregularis]|uniref:CCHC-type domain-containing protein n=1 Tax=Rhizophagus irregularis TaxID=588596 RepID=A0A915ZA73_9GLOM|nr:unnamed protein product [Rhizophagus irregularis]
MKKVKIHIFDQFDFLIVANILLIHGVTNEWEVSAYVSRIQKTLTFARIFTNIEMADAYQNLFEDLFNCIEKDTGDIFNFYHIHGRGLGCIIADQHKVQALGLGRYLNSKYPNLTPVEHLQHIYKLCQVHYKRNIDKNKQISSEIRSAMYLVPTLDTQEEVLIVLDKIQSSGELGAEAWVKDKRVSWVLSGISIAFTKMDHIIWNQTPNNTNVGESAHANVNHDGRNLSLLAGIVRGCNFDKRQWESGNVYEKYNIPDSYRDKSELARSIQAEKRAAKKQSAACSNVATASVRNVARKSYVCVHFSAQSDVDDALKRDTAPLTNSQKEGASAPTFTLFTTIKPDKTEDKKVAAKNCTIQVIDIPLYRKGADVRAAFSNFGNIVKLSLVTKGLYQNAYIQFDSTAALTYFTENAWSHFIYEDAVRVLPLTLSKNEQENRQLHCFKLIGLPRNTNARDLIEYLKSINARSCFLPRNAKNYRTFNYAYVNFLTEEDIIKAAQTHHSYKSKPLYWTSPDAQCCNFCGNPNHLAKSCNRQQSKKKSFADAVKGKNQGRPRNNNGYNRTPNSNLQNGTASGGSMHDNQLVDAQLH